MKISMLLIFSFLFTFQLRSQTIVLKGSISGNLKHQPLSGVNIVLMDSLKTSVLGYTFSDLKGDFNMKIDSTGWLKLLISSLGYESLSKYIKIEKGAKQLKLEIKLKEKALKLDEVIIHSKSPISQKKDTITIQTKFFVQGNEQNVEELLTKIPGLNIDNTGRIKVGDQEIEKLMIDGDDFFEKGYQLLSKNMPAYPIQEVEILKNYSTHRLLKGIEETNKVALNLKLNEKSKRIWFGNFDIGYGNNNFYELRYNLMNFGKTNKFYFFTNLNNTGYYTSQDVDNLISKTTEISSLGDNHRAQTLIDLTFPSLDFTTNRSDFNDVKLLSLNAIFNITNKIKITTLGFFNWDNKDFFKNNTDQIILNNYNFINKQDYLLQDMRNITFGDFDITYDISKTQVLEVKSKYNERNNKSLTHLTFNGESTKENLFQSTRVFDQKVSYTNKLRGKKVLILTGRYIHEIVPQNYRINKFFFRELLPLTRANNLTQKNLNRMQFAAANIHVLDRKDNGDLMEFELSDEFKNDKLITELSLFENNSLLGNPNEYQNELDYKTNDLYLKGKYRLSIKKLEVSGELAFHQLVNELRLIDGQKKQSPFFINPSLGIEYKINNNNIISTSYSNNTTNASVLQVYDNFALTGFRSLSKGLGDLTQLNATTLLFNYQLGNWSKRFFANTMILYNKNHDYFSSSTLIEQNYTLSEKIIIKDRKFLSINSKLDYYMSNISSNIKLDLGYYQSEFKNVINNSDLREVITKNYTYGLELRSGFNDFFNFHLGTKWTTNRVQSGLDRTFTKNISFVDLSFAVNDSFDLQGQAEGYFFGSQQEHNKYYFLDVDARYVLKKNKLTLGLSGKNLCNTQQLKTYAISDIGTSETTYRLLPRYVLLKVAYRF